MLKVNIIGIGPGNPDLLTKEAVKAIEASNILIGDKRMLANFQAEGKVSYATINTKAISDIAAKADPLKDEIAILVSGDVGFFSLAKTIKEKLPECKCARFCGISSLVYFAAKLEMSWEDARIVSMHGREQNLVAAVAASEKVFSLTGGSNSPQALCKTLAEHGLGDVYVYVGSNLSYPEESIAEGTAQAMAAREFPSLSVMMILNPTPRKGLMHVHGLADDLFLRDKVPMTKQEVRSVSISKLAPRADDIIYDVGAGTGSCSVELALIARKGKVFAFERNPLALGLLAKNKELFGVGNLTVVSGEALENMKLAPPPDCAFIGGSGGDLCDMLDVIYEKNTDCRVVINAITLETLAETVAYYKSRPGYRLEIANVFVARNRQLGKYNLMMAQNPVYVINAAKD